ncbi:Serine/threonine-protein kinase ksg1 [Neolecta irregularis DAH-3]|uniref:non-specific serine/threonine protein kinase n=1 Tax=Neolecta irregularis (strain DAH-3) TaxID=1198029 RepID=A0A1U7LN19_NEOID|nr:Serine/threonine-protein kinase ksg1 [Neolecta irregularis DAH-3]|eukprot:OLL23983.1 Serine/threonine-protein kinase ksg1 [Neolecta irregularis DAH-3]
MIVDDHGHTSDTLGGLNITNLTEADDLDALGGQGDQQQQQPQQQQQQQQAPKRNSLAASAFRSDSATRSFRVPPPLDRHRTLPYSNGNGYYQSHRASQLSQHSLSSVSSQGRLDSTSTRLVSQKEDWTDKGAAVIYKIEKNPSSDEQATKIIKKGVKDFNFGRTLGEGSYSTVVAATDRQTLKEYAIKILDKRHIIKEKKVKYVNIEKNTLNRLGDHPGVVSLYYTFQDERSLFYVLDLAANGELLGVLKRLGSFDEECTRYYGGQILDALDYMHTKGIIHRDLKPENILLDEHMRIKLTDFGTAKILDQNEGESQDQARANSFVGTAEYVSPELLTDKAAYKSSDLWAFGCIIYQLLSGRPPFKASNEYQTFQKIVHLDYSFPLGFPAHARDLVSKLLVLDPKDRLTIEDIKKHEFFAGVEWGRAIWKANPPKLRPHRPDTIIRLSGYPSTASLPILSAHSSMSTKIGNLGLQRQSSEGRLLGSHGELASPPSTLDLEWTHLLLHNERILRFGNVIVSCGMSCTLTPNKLAKRLLQRKKVRTLLITNGGRAFFVYPDKKVKAEIELTPATMFFAKGKTFTIETPERSFVFEDPAGRPFEWIEKLEEAKKIACKNPVFNGSIEGVALMDSGSIDVFLRMSIPYDDLWQRSEAYDDVRNDLTKTQIQTDTD